MTRRRSAAAFSLVEVTLALGVMAFAMLAIFGLLPIGLNSNATALQQTAAVNLATGLIADLRQTPSAADIAASGGTLTAKSPRYAVDLSQATSTIYLDESGVLQSAATNARYKVTIALNSPPSGKRFATSGNITIGWPAGAPTPSGSVSAFVALDRN